MKLVVLLALVAATEALKIAAKPSLATAKLDAPSTLVAAGPAEVKALRGGFDMGMLQLLSYFFFWYLGNYYCPRPRPKRKLRGAMDSVVRHRYE